ncbi:MULTISPECIES: 50S ribosomal protein L29 [Crateriforma]|uniref:Large ribosomal subunit protein uL29 n=1 Tax=Crateriforma conspicua TaxID=2527996 RepID=A0A5C6FWH2_9PLAN|nr:MULTISPECIES: 50S ribosomal protein L29 [Crateriforma]QDV64634.1 50S ribosomal protein L29 [Crateriforma conspicua]TWT70031.1 50S ribosomal protein L29 [Crateriforma conspicua]TWU66005.1 50S ribosomal protein L29 [Crateriforma conspicua]
MATNTELREMSDEQLEATAKEAAETLFRLRFQSQSERLNTPSEMKKNRRLIARIKTIQTERRIAAENASATA